MLTLRYYLALKAEALHAAGRNPEPLPRFEFYILSHKNHLLYPLETMALFFNTLWGGSQRSILTRRLLCSTKNARICPFNKTASLLQPLIRLFVDVQVRIRELLYGRKCLLDCFIGF